MLFKARLTLPILAALAALPLPVAAAGVDETARTATQNACRIFGWSIDPDPTGLRVRAGPGLRAPEIGRLPPFIRSPEGDYGPAFAIVGAAGGWLRITGASDAWAPDNRLPRPVFSGEGWVHGSLVTVAVQSSTGRDAPSAEAPTVVDTGSDWLTARGEVTGILDCVGAWAKLAYRVTDSGPVTGPRRGQAWFEGICGEQRTTCDGIPERQPPKEPVKTGP